MLVLKNGDRITDELKRIWDNKILIKPEYLDEFKVDVSVLYSYNWFFSDPWFFASGISFERDLSLNWIAA